MNKKISLLFLLSGACLASCGGGNKPAENTHVVTWNLNNGEVIQETYHDGDIPEYKGETPTKKDDEIIDNYYQTGYLFTNWKDNHNQDLHPVTEDVEYFAQYEERQVVTRFIVPTSEIKNKTVKFNYEGTCEGVSWDTGVSLDKNITTPGTIEHPFGDSFIGDYEVISIFGNVTSVTLSEKKTSFYVPLAEGNEEILCIILGSHINTIHSYAYSGLTSLNTVYIPSTVSKVEADIASESDLAGQSLVFYIEHGTAPSTWDQNWAAVTSSHSKNYPSYYSVHALGFDNGYTYVSINYNNYEELAITGFYHKVGMTGELEVPLTEKINGEDMPVTAIIYEPFRDNPNLEQIKLPETISCIGKNSFKDCTQLGSVQSSGDGARPWPSKLEVIEESAFDGCRNLKIGFNFNASSVLTTIGDKAFNSSGITKFTANPALKSIGKLAFCQTTSLSEVNLYMATKLTVLNKSVFEGASLSKFTFSLAIEEIGSRAFANAISPNFEGGAVVLPQNLKKIDSQAFVGLPAGVALDATAFDTAKKIPEGSLDMLGTSGSTNTIYIKDENLKQAFLDKQWPQKAKYVVKS